MYKVMLIDDEESLQDAIKRLVIAGGYAFCGARDALEGREVLLREKPDLLLLDVMLPTVSCSCASKQTYGATASPSPRRAASLAGR